jgi:alcohol dehydrogenase
MARFPRFTSIQKQIEVPMLILSFLWLCILVAELAYGENTLLYQIGNILWFIFLIYFLIRLAFAQSRWTFLKKNWLFLVAVLVSILRFIPFLQALPWIRVLTATFGTQVIWIFASADQGMRYIRKALGRRGVGYALAFSSVVILAGAAGMLHFERESTDPGRLQSYPRAIWWSAMQMTNIGSSYNITTQGGRAVGLGISVYAAAMFGYLTALFATFFIDREIKDPKIEMARQKLLQDLQEQMKTLSTQMTWLQNCTGFRDHSFSKGVFMKALVYQSPGKIQLVDSPKPKIQIPTDAIVRVLKTTICGTDLHIMKGGLPAVTSGRILGHEGVGIVDEVGTNVTSFKSGDHVIISCISSCGKCPNCKKGMYSHCENGGGWILGNTIDGTQAEFVRIPFADNSLYSVPQGADEEALVMLSDALPTAFECGVLNGKVSPGDTVAIIGAGPVGMAALLTAQFFSPAELIVVDTDENRLEVAKKLGATQVINNADGKAATKIMEYTKNRGVDVAIEAIGIKESFDICQSIIAAGGHIANIGVHGHPVQLNLDKLWDRNMTLTTRLVDTVTTPLLLKTVLAGKIEPKKLITHHFALKDMIKAYATFGNASSEKALKVIIHNG